MDEEEFSLKVELEQLLVLATHGLYKRDDSLRALAELRERLRLLVDVVE